MPSSSLASLATWPARRSFPRAFKRMQRIDVQVAGVQGQRKVTLQRPARTVKLVR